MITVEHLTKCYGDFMAVKDLSFEIDEGHVYGFLGPNGAGKSTTMNIMTGCLSATEGKVTIGGYDIFEQPEQAKRMIGYLPEQPPLYMNETPVEYLRFVGAAKGLKGQELREQVESVIQQTKIEDVKNRLISTLSKGYKQRVGIAQALLGNPKVIILDEPTVGLDPIQIIEIRDLIRQLGQNHTVILSSHILSEVQAICEKVLIIAKGKLVAFDAPENLEKLLLAQNGVSFIVEATMEEVKEILANIEQCVTWNGEEQEEGTVKVYAQIDNNNLREFCRQIFFAFAERKRAIIEMTSKKANLEDVFIELTEAEDVGEENSAQKSESEDASSMQEPVLENESENEEVYEK